MEKGYLFVLNGTDYYIMKFASSLIIFPGDRGGVWC